MKFCIISPNASKNPVEEPFWKKVIVEKGYVFMGWDEDKSFGRRFIEDINIGDFILVAQGANWQKRLFIGGIVVSEALHGHIEGTPRATYYRKLDPFLSKEELERLNLIFDGTAYGEANQIPALYVLHPYKNEADKELASALEKGIQEQIKHKSMLEKIELLKYKRQIILQGPPGTGKTHYAKLIAKKIISTNEQPVLTDQFITDNLSVGMEISTITDYNTFEILSVDMEKFKIVPKGSTYQPYVYFNQIIQCFEQKGWGKKVVDYDKSGTGPYIVGIAKYLFENINNQKCKLIQFHPAYTYEDFVRGITAIANDKGQVEYKVENKLLAEFAKSAIENPEANFVLIIDEINRANLPSVLGELIYALEYRNESVESMYALNGKKSLILPSNLYIIGTMNTADRSVGHIDYAIRRRFAFVDMQPDKSIIEKEIEDNEVKKLAIEIYDKVAALFNEKKDENDNTEVCLASDFKAKDVQIGHSYFLAKTLVDLKLKLEYEIKPILYEYLKDGVLLENAKKSIDSLSL